MADRLADLLRYARVRHLPVILLGTGLLLAAQAFLGSLTMSFPSSAGTITVPFRRELPLGYGALAAASLRSSLATLEAAAGRWFRRLERGHVVALLILCALSSGLVEWATAGPGEAGICVCSVVLWWGLAILSGRLFGWLLSWALPLASVFPLIYFAQDRLGHPRWWAWTGQQHVTPALLGMTAAAVALGIAAFACTAWRGRSLVARASRLSPRRPRPAPPQALSVGRPARPGVPAAPPPNGR